MRTTIFQVPYLQAQQAIRWQEEQLNRLTPHSTDLIILPEYANATGIEQPDELLIFLETEGERFIQSLSAHAKRLDAAIAAGVIQKDAQGQLRNRIIFINPLGCLFDYLDKLHLTDMERHMNIVPADHVRVIEYNGIRFAGAICFDIYFPEYFAMLADRNIDIIIAPSYQRGESAQRIIALSQTRALDAGCYILRSSYSVNNSEDKAGHSLVAAPDGTIVQALGGKPGIFTCDISPKHPFIKPASFGGKPTTHIALIASHRRPAFYRHATFQPTTPSLCAHRGLSSAIPENTIPSFAAAIAAGAHEIEFDVYLTKDDVPVIIHDVDMNRVANTDLNVTQATWREIQEIDLACVYGPAWENLRIPRLEQVLDLCNGRVGLNIHMKMAGERGKAVRIVAAELAKRNLIDSAYIGGEADILEALTRYAPEITRSCMADQEHSDKLIDNALHYHCQRLQFFSQYVEKQHVERAHRHGIHCNVFYADTHQEMKRMLDLGIDTVLTNVPMKFLSMPEFRDNQ